MREISTEEGFSLIELLFVLVIIAALTAIAIPGYIGISNRAREASVIATAGGAVDDLSTWLHSAVSPRNDSREVDTNFNATIDNTDKTNIELYNDGVAKTYAQGRNTILKERSPWYTDIPLWNIDNSILNGRITLIQESSTSIKMIAKNKSGEIIFERTLSAD
jgi:prepilin-type N-terminal cleavage/methylation domain-containing protein